MSIDAVFIGRLIEIIWINLLLSGDNAVVIALACRDLPPRQRKWGIILGTAPAALLRIGGALVITHLMAIPYLRLVGGALLLWIAVDLLREDEADGALVRARAGLWTAVRVIVVADVIMSLDNVLAVAAAAQGSVVLMVIGLGISVPLVIVGGAVVVAVMARFPLIVSAGGVLIGYVAGDVALGDPALAPWIGANVSALDPAVPVASAAVVVPTAKLLSRLRQRRRPGDEDL